MLLFFRRISLSVAVAIMLAVSSMLAPAPASAVVLHNGLIAVHNLLRGPLQVNIVTETGHVWEEGTVNPGATFYSERCCYVAGIWYRVRLFSRGAWDPVQKKFVELIETEYKVKPVLCNFKGIPYGFAEFTVTYRGAVDIIPHHGCYTDIRQ